MIILDVATQDGDIVIREDELASVTDAGACDTSIIPKATDQLVRGRCEADARDERQQPRATSCHLRSHGNWDVMLIQFSPLNDPLMQGRRKGKAN